MLVILKRRTLVILDLYLLKNERKTKTTGTSNRRDHQTKKAEYTKNVHSLKAKTDVMAPNVEAVQDREEKKRNKNDDVHFVYTLIYESY